MRVGRILKAVRRAGRVRAIRAKHRRRLLAAAILPVALYAAEHTPWMQSELDRLAKMAVRVAGLAVLGVPLEVSRLLLPAEVHPDWKARLAAIERWSREVWIAKHRPPGGFPADAHLTGELEWAWAIAIGMWDDGPPVAECPALAAVLEATKGLQLAWTGPGTLKCLSTRLELSLTEGSPAMLKKILKARWASSQRERLATLLQRRIDQLSATGAAGEVDKGLGFLGRLPGLGAGLHGSKVADLLCKPSLSLHAKQVLLSTVWGVFPCGAWLAQHGWDQAALCEVCGGVDDLGHCVIGCPGEQEQEMESPTLRL